MMKVLYISDRQDGGILRHVKCLRECLPPEVETYEIGLGGDEEFAGSSGHDMREFRQIRRVVEEFKPDIVHFHIPNLLMALYVGRLTSVPCVCSWHTPTTSRPKVGERLFFWLLGRRTYYLPVSSVTWHGLKQWLPYASGEVFFNPLKLKPRNTRKEGPFTVGMVGRSAYQKDWPSFHKVEALVRKSRPDVMFLNAGEEKACDGPEAIQMMDLFVMTSRHEELPTTLLECFALGTPACGFIPEGGVTDILAFSNGPLREAFIGERNVSRLAEIVLALLGDPERRKALVEDGRQILSSHFDAEKNCKGQLMDIYRRLAK